MPPPTLPAKAEIDVSVMTLVSALGAVFGALALFQPKLAVPAAMKREAGSVELAFRSLYVIPQYFNAAVIFCLSLALFAAFLRSIRPAFFAQSQWLTTFASFFVFGNIIWILFLAVLIVALVKFNWLSWLLLGATAVASLLPIPRLRGAFGHHGTSAGWHQALNVCRAWDKGQPLLLNREQIERLADLVLHRLTLSPSAPGNFAATPATATPDARANIALLGCILEATHYAQRWTSPKWSEFYAALADIHATSKIFDPTEVLNFPSGDEFATRLRNELATNIASRSQPVPTDKYLAAAGNLALTWNVLRRHSGRVLHLVPSWAHLVGGRLYWLDRRLSRLPMLNSEGMRPQLIKLLARWETLPWAKASVFVQPFAKKQGWLLLQETALRVLPEQRDVTFWGVGDVPLTRIACFRIFRRVVTKVREKHSPEASAVDQAHPKEWDLLAAADFALWDWAAEQEAKGRAENWDTGKGWQWKLDNGRASKKS